MTGVHRRTVQTGSSPGPAPAPAARLLAAALRRHAAGLNSSRARLTRSNIAPDMSWRSRTSPSHGPCLCRHPLHPRPAPSGGAWRAQTEAPHSTQFHHAGARQPSTEHRRVTTCAHSRQSCTASAGPPCSEQSPASALPSARCSSSHRASAFTHLRHRRASSRGTPCCAHTVSWQRPQVPSIPCPQPATTHLPSPLHSHPWQSWPPLPAPPCAAHTGFAQPSHSQAAPCPHRSSEQQPRPGPPRSPPPPLPWRTKCHATAAIPPPAARHPPSPSQSPTEPSSSRSP